MSIRKVGVKLGILTEYVVRRNWYFYCIVSPLAKSLPRANIAWLVRILLAASSVLRMISTSPGRDLGGIRHYRFRDWIAAHSSPLTRSQRVGVSVGVDWHKVDNQNLPSVVVVVLRSISVVVVPVGDYGLVKWMGTMRWCPNCPLPTYQR